MPSPNSFKIPIIWFEIVNELDDPTVVEGEVISVSDVEQPALEAGKES